MKRTIILLGLIAISFAAIAATPPTAEPQPAPKADAARPANPVFDCYRMNSAWGFVMAGAMIDSNGAIFRYHIKGKPWAPTIKVTDGVEWIDAMPLRAKFAGATHDGNVDTQAFAENRALIANAATGKIERADGGARDAGTSTCHAYIHDATQQRYRDVRLGSDSGVADVRETNSAAAAQTLLNWLKTVGVAN